MLPQRSKHPRTRNGYNAQGVNLNLPVTLDPLEVVFASPFLTNLSFQAELAAGVNPSGYLVAAEHL